MTYDSIRDALKNTGFEVVEAYGGYSLYDRTLEDGHQMLSNVPDTFALVEILLGVCDFVRKGS